jgi:hypothetical protein
LHSADRFPSIGGLKVIIDRWSMDRRQLAFRNQAFLAAPSPYPDDIKTLLHWNGHTIVILWPDELTLDRQCPTRRLRSLSEKHGEFEFEPSPTELNKNETGNGREESVLQMI